MQGRSFVRGAQIGGHVEVGRLSLAGRRPVVSGPRESIWRLFGQHFGAWRNARGGPQPRKSKRSPKVRLSASEIRSFDSSAGERAGRQQLQLELRGGRNCS